MIFSIGLLLAWASYVGFYFLLFWNYLPFALAAQELTELTKRYS